LIGVAIDRRLSNLALAQVTVGLRGWPLIKSPVSQRKLQRRLALLGCPQDCRRPVCEHLGPSIGHTRPKLLSNGAEIRFRSHTDRLARTKDVQSRCESQGHLRSPL